MCLCKEVDAVEHGQIRLASVRPKHHLPHDIFTLHPLNTHAPANFPTTAPAYMPPTIVTGHFCHSRSQSSGMGIAPTHAPTQAPSVMPNTSSTGICRLAIWNHVSFTRPWA